jgi:hypothetical protein
MVLHTQTDTILGRIEHELYAVPMGEIAAAWRDRHIKNMLTDAY